MTESKLLGRWFIVCFIFLAIFKILHFPHTFMFLMKNYPQNFGGAPQIFGGLPHFNGGYLSPNYLGYPNFIGGVGKFHYGLCKYYIICQLMTVFVVFLMQSCNILTYFYIFMDFCTLLTYFFCLKNS